MEIIIQNLLDPLPLLVLALITAASLYTLAKGSDLLVEEAVSLSIRWGMPKMVIGATIVSLGTTLPEASVSVLAAIKGNPDLALGNAIGSIIVDTGLIIGIAAIIGKLKIHKNSINYQGRIQLAAAVLLSIVSLPFFSKGPNGVIHQWMGWLFIALLVLYILMSIKWAKNTDSQAEIIEDSASPLIIILKIALGIAIVIISSQILIPCVEISATRIGIPQSVIAATLVAFGTSLPELMTAITAVRKGHGELAIGNIIGADILNVLFVIGAAASVTPQGLIVPLDFYRLQIPTMLLVLVIFRMFCKNKRGYIGFKQGIFLLFFYLVYLILNYTWI